MKRAEAREEAVQALYAADALGSPPDTGRLTKRAAGLVNGVSEHAAEIDAVIAKIAHGWRIERMPLVDRNVIRLGVFELMYTDTPVGVVVSQAVEIAKQYSTARSGSFVNGILGRLADELAAAGNEVAGAAE